MNKDRIDTINDFLKYNNIIYKIYMKLADLEKNNLINSEEYNDLISILRNTIKKYDRLLRKYSITDSYFDNFLSMIEEMVDYWVNDGIEYVNDTVYDNDLIKKRIINYIDSYKSENSIVKDIEDYDDIIATIDGENYTLMDGINVLEEEYGDDLKEDFTVAFGLDDTSKELEALFNKFEYFKDSIEIEVFMCFLLNAIYNCNDTEFKNRLIDVKYKLIYLFRALENTFISDPTNVINIDKYNAEMVNLFKDYPSLYPEYAKTISERTALFLDAIIKREKKEFKDYDDYVVEYLLELKLKTFFSLINDEEINDILDAGLQYAYITAKTSIDKGMLGRTINSLKRKRIKQ